MLVPYLEGQGIGKLDAVIVTHPHADHYQGLMAVLDRFPVKVVYTNGRRASGYLYRQFAQQAEEIGIRSLQSGEQLSIGDVMISVLHPPLNGDFAGNDGSLVLRLEFGRTSFLLTGDVEKRGQQRLLPGAGFLSSTVLKVPHHGSADAFCPQFIATVDPQVAVVTGGAPWRGQPDPKVLSYLRQRGCLVCQTAAQGAVRLQSDGSRFTVRVFKKNLPYVSWWQGRVSGQGQRRVNCAD